MHCIDEPQLLIPVFKWSSLITLGNGGQKLGSRRRGVLGFPFEKLNFKKRLF